MVDCTPDLVDGGRRINVRNDAESIENELTSKSALEAVRDTVA